MKIRKLLFSAGLLGGFVVCLLFTYSRAPGLYDGLWEDEIHYHVPVLMSPTVHSARADMGPIMKPFLDFAIRRWIWFSSFGFSVYEQRLALVSLLYAALHLTLWMLLPWTPNLGLRWIAVVLLGFCPVEMQYSTEAQGYSFCSLAPTLMAFSFLWSCRFLDEKKTTAALTVFLLAIATYLNSHFFAWPSCFLMMLAFAYYASGAPLMEAVERRAFYGRLLIGVGAIFLGSVVADKPGLYFLLFRTPSARAGFHADWKGALAYLPQAWTLLHVPALLYLLAAVAGLLHPQRAKRVLAWVSVLTVFLAKYALVILLTARSSYGVAARYLIMFLSPSIWVLVLGLDSAALLAEHLRRRAGTLVVAGALTVVLLRAAPQLRELLPDAKHGWDIARRTPPNYSTTYDFFERVKSYHRPALILTNHAWSSDIPQMYMTQFGAKATPPVVVLNTLGSFETSPDVLSAQTKQFLADYGGQGLVVFFYENPRSSLISCGLSLDALYKRPEGDCVGIVAANSFSFAAK